MQAQQVTLDQVMEATSDAVDSGLLRFSTGAVSAPAARSRRPNQRIGIRNVLPVVTPADLAEVPVATEAARCGSATSRPWRRTTSR